MKDYFVAGLVLLGILVLFGWVMIKLIEAQM